MEIKFLTPLRVERGEGRWTLVTQFAVQVDERVYSVPPGFVTDFASVPRLPLAYYLAAGRGVKAAVLHDYLYETKARPREEADSIFYHALLAEGEPELIAKLMHDAVRLAGGSHYGEDAPALEVARADWPPAP